MTPERWRAADDLFQQAADLPHSERSAFLDQHCPDPDLRRDVEILLDSLKTGDVTAAANAVKLATDAWAREQPSLGVGAMVGPYKLAALIGQGGMGAVYRATREDDEFHKQVAVKVVKRDMGTVAILQRFRTERQILATLEHPGIARLLDGGTAQGIPFFVMEFVDGKAITSYCRDRNLSPPDRVRLFLQVCDAVQYAHRNLVVHRDLKPGNILVNESGSVKLLDFGIAKVLTPDLGVESSQTVGLRLFTPDYASPEQVRGETVGTTADIYSLGTVLYELLSGQRAHRITTYTPLEIVEVICRRDPVPLSQAAPPPFRSAVAGDLETIVAKAMDKDPARRYASVDLLRLDLENYLEGRPISARPPALLYLAGKFIRRHRISVAVAGVSAAALVLTAAFALYQATQARDRFQQVRRMARTMLFEFHDELDRVPGNTKAKALLVSTAREYLDNLSRSAGRDRELIAELAEAYEKLAQVQGGTSDVNLGNRIAALDSRRRALDLRLRIAGTAARSDSGMIDVAARLANDLRDLGRIQESVAAGRHAVDLAIRYLPRSAAYRNNLSTAHAFYARALQDNGQLSEALMEYERAEQALVAWGDPPLRNLLSVQQDRADLLHTAGRVEEAVALLSEVERKLTTMIDGTVEERVRLRLERLRNLTRVMLAEMYYDPFTASLNQPAEAMRYRNLVSASWRHLQSLDPHDSMAKLNMAICDSESALTQILLDPADAEHRARGAYSIFVTLDGGAPNDTHTTPRRARAQTRLGVVLSANNRLPEALPLLRESVATQRALAARQPDNLRFAGSLVWTLTALAEAERKAGNPDAAGRLSEEAITLAPRLASSLDVGERRYAEKAYRDRAAADPPNRCQWLSKAKALWEDAALLKTPWLEARRTEYGTCP
ncbi:MAG: serine/threonine protein kinase [Bryobacterales bacterium]|nr:serine/threonine protein kinase [Bryobacterales bacterium]